MPISVTLQRSLDDAIAAENFYEAHQIYLTIINRLIKQASYDEAATVISQGAKWLFESGQSKSALDLASKLFEMLKEPWLDVEYAERIKTVLSTLPLNHSGVRALVAQLFK